MKLKEQINKEKSELNLMHGFISNPNLHMGFGFRYRPNLLRFQGRIWQEPIRNLTQLQPYGQYKKANYNEQVSMQVPKSLN